MTRWGWLGVGFLLLRLATPVPLGQQPQPASASEIKALIDQLVSPNRKPQVEEGSSAEPGLPRDFDHKKQRQVYRAAARLAELGPQAFPYLIERWGDERYCMTGEDRASGAFVHKTVGQICREIIADQLQPYGRWPTGVTPDDRPRPRFRPSYPDDVLGESQESARRWWEKNRHRRLRQMQLDALDWVIAGGHEGRGHTEEDLQLLQRLRKELVQSRKPLQGGLGSYGGFDPAEE